jgi:hypothetical protein
MRIQKKHAFWIAIVNFNYMLFHDSPENPHPEEPAVRPNGEIYVADYVPEILQDAFAYHEWIEIEMLKKLKLDESKLISGAQEGNRIINYIHRTAKKGEKNMIRERNAQREYRNFLNQWNQKCGKRG